MLLPTTPSDVEDIVKTNTGLLPIGGGSKPALSGMLDGATPVGLEKLSGIVEYDPDEYTLTALAGTPVGLVAEAVEANGQYLPFDPLFVEAGATLGGSVAANSSGPGRYRYGGMRDFILGVRFVDGLGRTVRGGGKVVKNASGFDLPKFMVGSLGRFGILTEVTLKVFPKPKRYTTLSLRYASLQACLHTIFALANQPFELDGLDIKPGNSPADPPRLLIRLGGLPESLAGRAARLSSWIDRHAPAKSIDTLSDEDDSAYWSDLNRMGWASDEPCLIKVPLAPKQIPALQHALPAVKTYFSVGGHVAWIAAAVEQLDVIDQTLCDQKLAAQLMRGPQGGPYLGHHGWLPLAQRVKRALDPNGRFLTL